MEIIVKPLDPKLDQEIEHDFTQALNFLRDGDKSSAAAAAQRGWARMPAPVFGWDSSLSYLRAAVRIYREAGEFNRAIDLLQQHLKSEFYRDYEYHPYFLLGTVYFAMADMESARSNFKTANQISKGRCFVGEAPAYKKLLSGK